MYNPIELTGRIENIVLQGEKKKYYRFRPTRFYGGIATADTVGCNLRCKFCWSANSVWNAAQTGQFYTAEEVAETMLNIAEGKRYHQVRVSGGEPTIGKAHLLNLLEHVHPDLWFILETNGILLGADKTYVEELSVFNNLHVRVCIKGVDAEEFTFLTGAESGYDYQMKALDVLRNSTVSFNIALVSIRKDKQPFYEELGNRGSNTVKVEEEEITLYPQVKKRLEREGLIDYFK